MAQLITQNGCAALRNLPLGTNFDLSIVVQAISFQPNGEKYVVTVTDGKETLKIILQSLFTQYVIDGKYYPGCILKVVQTLVTRGPGGK